MTLEPPLLSIAIVNWNTCSLLIDALQSIYSAPPPFDFEVIVVDNASTDGSANTVASRFPQVKLIASQTNTGYAHGNNLAMQSASGAFVLLLNPDVILPPGSLQRAVECMHLHPEAGALGVRQVFPDGVLQLSVRGFPTPGAVFWELVGLSRLFPNNRTLGAYRMMWFHYDNLQEVDQPMGTFLLIRREALEQTGRMDEQFPIFFNDVDWCLRCKKAGWRILFTPDVQITHYGGAGTSQAAGIAWESRRSLLDFYAKHYSSPLYLPLRAMIAAASWPYAIWKGRQHKKHRRERESA